jgi:cell division protein FtsB
MTGLNLAAEPTHPSPRRARPTPSRLRLPASRQGVAWLAVVVIVGMLLAVQFGRQIYLNWEIGQREAAVQAELAAVEAENARLEQELAYVRSDAYVDAEARRLLNVGLPGEEALIIPPGAEQPLPEELTRVAPPKPLLVQWFELFFGS